MFAPKHKSEDEVIPVPYIPHLYAVSFTTKMLARIQKRGNISDLLASHESGAFTATCDILVRSSVRCQPQLRSEEKNGTIHTISDQPPQERPTRLRHRSPLTLFVELGCFARRLPRGRRSILMQRVRNKRESGFQRKLDEALVRLLSVYFENV